MFLEWRFEAGHGVNSSHNEPNIDPFIRFAIPRALPGSRFGEAIKERIMLSLAPKKRTLKYEHRRAKLRRPVNRLQIQQAKSSSP
ncbi:hypothetical protein [uncultured Roseobacter sp.]|uniref:hypothetical protein n=1 Tax=uncultured Roseobacter sp. TaxID=114847 RepID=UPI00261AD45E|nr:hypothetical protein [uncultured Roseobacter sp.]